MPNQLVLPIVPGQIPQGFCPSSEQERWNTYATYGSVVFPDTFAGVILSATKPSDTTKAWGQLDQYGRLIRIYNYANGIWVSMHPVYPGLTMWWFSALPDFNSFDGGDANAASETSGPMWQQAKDSSGTTIAAKFPIVAGTLPSSTLLSVGDTGGEENHTLTIPEMPSHNHGAPTGECITQVDRASDINAVGMDPTNTYPNGDSDWTGLTGGGQAHNNMPPYIVGYLLQRSARVFYSVS